MATGSDDADDTDAMNDMGDRDATDDRDDMGDANAAEDANATDATDAATNPPETPVVLFDGVCNLCNGVIQFLIPRDPEGRLKYAALQSEPGQALLERHDFPTEEFDSFVLVEGDRTYTKSGAAIRIAELLGWPYRIAGVGRVVPRRIRDRLYEFVADNRYDWFGRKDQCMIPDEDVSDRFLS